MDVRRTPGEPGFSSACPCTLKVLGEIFVFLFGFTEFVEGANFDTL